ncbi:hypothetical protein PMIN03_006729 [Paraphaeosphaeria minitans]
MSSDPVTMYLFPLYWLYEAKKNPFSSSYLSMCLLCLSLFPIDTLWLSGRNFLGSTWHHASGKHASKSAQSGIVAVYKYVNDCNTEARCEYECFPMPPMLFFGM